MHDRARLGALYRYPIKGFSGQELPEAELAPGRGILYDRFLGIANGQALLTVEGWSSCSCFVRMTANDGLPLFRIDFNDAALSLSIRTPDGDSVSIDLTKVGGLECANQRIATWFPRGRLTTPRLVRRVKDLGWWDVEDAPLTIINLETLRDLGSRTQCDIDPRRFRGNLYIDDMPAWCEFETQGKRLRIGQAELEVIRPIERCKATSIDPSTGKSTLNIPALLATHIGHIYLGLHARVVKAGRVRAGDEVEVLGEASSKTQANRVHPDLPSPTHWPRYGTIEQRAVESADVTSFWIRDPLARLRPVPLPGQHLRVHLQSPDSVPWWRSYTISAVDNDRLRLSIKNETERRSVSHKLHEVLAPGARLLISGPFGSFHLGDPSERPLILASGGIGITPMVAILRALDQRKDRTRSVLVLHGARTRRMLALWPEVQSLLGRLPSARWLLYLNEMDEGEQPTSTTRQGVPDSSVFDGMSVRDAEAYICGPSPFMSAVRQWLAAAGTPPESIFTEAFASPSAVRMKPKAVPFAGPFEVQFAKSEATAEWTQRDGSLLELADSAGLSLAANCRAGVCGSCRQVLRRGSVVHLTEPPFPVGPHEVLTCCAVPTSNIVIDA